MPVQSAFAFNSNEIFSTLGNMIISQRVLSDNIDRGGESLLSLFKYDGGLYGDRALFYASDALKSYEWIQDSNDALNLLMTHRPADPKVKAIVIDKFRQIPLTTDAYMSKRAFADEGTFSQFTTVMIGWMDDTKYLYDESVINVAVGTTKTTTGRQSQTVTFQSGASSKADIEAQNRLNAQAIAKKAADILSDLVSPRNGKFYNDYGFRRKYKKSDFVTIWNADAINEITKQDLPTIYHEEGLDKVVGQPYTLAKEYFGITITASNVSTYSAGTPTTNKPIDSDDGSYDPGTNNANGMLCCNIECDITVGGVDYHLMPGDEIPAGTIIAAAAGAGKLVYGQVYIVDASILFKIVHKDSMKYMSAFTTSSEFWNGKNLSTNRYLTFGYADPFSTEGIRLPNYPFITVSKA